MWKFEHTIETRASAEAIFALMADVGTWPEWNPGVERMELDGPFVAGTSGTMVMPGGESLATRLAWVEPGRGFEDETPIPGEEAVVRVRHLLDVQPDGGTRITYAATIEGPGAEAVGSSVGPQVTADFPEVMAALAARAEAAFRL